MFSNLCFDLVACAGVVGACHMAVLRRVGCLHRANTVNHKVFRESTTFAEVPWTKTENLGAQMEVSTPWKTSTRIVSVRFDSN